MKHDMKKHDEAKQHHKEKVSHEKHAKKAITLPLARYCMSECKGKHKHKEK